MNDIKELKANLEQLLNRVSKLVIVPHTDVDFDALGSSIGLSLIARKFKIPACVVVNDNISDVEPGIKAIMDEASDKTSFVTKDECINTWNDNDGFTLTDVNKSELICLKEELQNLKEQTLVVDHHELGPTSLDAFYRYIDLNASSASEIVARLLCMFNIKFSKEVANYLLAGIHLDTVEVGNNASAETHRVIARLLDKGADYKQVSEYFIADYKSDRRVQDLVDLSQLCNLSIATVSAPEDILYTNKEIARAASYLLKYRVDASFVIANTGNNTISVSARSKNHLNVGEILKVLNGGGTRYSAAAKVYNSTVEEVTNKLQRVLKPGF